MLDSLELYAIQCYDTTQKHIAEIEALSSIEDVQNYNYKSDYPDKLNF